MERTLASGGLKNRETTMKLNESEIVDIKCNDMYIKEIKKMVYRDLDIYAVKRSIGSSNLNAELFYGSNAAWWCGYVEVPLNMYSLFEPRGYPNEAILDELDDPNSYDLVHVHGGYTYLDNGIPHVLDDNQRLFLGWDYNHWCDTEDCVTYDDVIDVGKKIVDSMLSKIHGSKEKECKQ